MNKNERTRVTINGNLYDDDEVFMGVAEVTLPNIQNITQNIKGLGIQGDIDVPVIGQINAMELSIKFTHASRNALILAQPRLHNLTLRVMDQEQDVVSKQFNKIGVRHHFGVQPKNLSAGTIAPASTSNASGTYSVDYWRAYEKRDGVEEKYLDIDQLAEKFEIDGVDYLADLREYT